MSRNTVIKSCFQLVPELWFHAHVRLFDYRGMDYELGADKVPWQYWDAVEKGEPYELPRKPNPVFEPIRRRLSLSAKQPR
jgi:hypothetical protein